MCATSPRCAGSNLTQRPRDRSRARQYVRKISGVAKTSDDAADASTVYNA